MILYSRTALRLHGGSFGHFAGLQVPPQGDEQFASERDDSDPSKAATPAAEALLVPERQPALGLEAQPAPSDLDRQMAYQLLACLADSLIAALLAALVRRRRQSFVAAWNHRRGEPRRPDRELSDDERVMRREFREAFWKFDSDLASAVNVRKAAEGNSELVRAIERAHVEAISLFDLVMENPDAFESEADLMETGQAKSAKEAAEIAANLLAQRLSKVYRSA